MDAGTAIIAAFLLSVFIIISLTRCIQDWAPPAAPPNYVPFRDPFALVPNYRRRDADLQLAAQGLLDRWPLRSIIRLLMGGPQPPMEPDAAIIPPMQHELADLVLVEPAHVA